MPSVAGISHPSLHVDAESDIPWSRVPSSAIVPFPENARAAIFVPLPVRCTRAFPETSIADTVASAGSATVADAANAAVSLAPGTPAGNQQLPLLQESPSAPFQE